MGKLGVAFVFLILASWLGVTGIGGVFLVVQGIDAARAHFSGISGTVAVASCTPHVKDLRQVGWDCSGRFTADDGSVTIPKVDLFPYIDPRPTRPVEVVVTDAAATTARPSSFAWWVPLAGGIAFLGIFAYTVVWYLRDPPTKTQDGRPRRRVGVRYEHRKRFSRPRVPGVR